MEKRPGPWHVLHHLPSRGQAVLDIGCNVGAALEDAHLYGFNDLYGIDINPAAAQTARERLSTLGAKSEVFQGSADRMPFESQSIDVAICSEVLEHIPAELRAGALKETFRVLKPGASMVLTTPANGLFAFLDPANARFAFPRLFERVSSLVGGRGREAGYENQKHGIVWHHHFTLEELEQLVVGAGFQIEQVRWRGSLLVPVCGWLQFPFYRLNRYDHPLLKLLNRVEEWDTSRDWGKSLGYDVLLVVRKPAQ